MKTDLKPYQQTTLAGIGIVALVIGVYAFFERKVAVCLTCFGLAMLLMWYLSRHEVD